MTPRRSKRPHGTIRQSQLVSMYGPGALVDLPTHSVIVGGLDSWTAAGMRTIEEPRLVAKLEELLPGVKNLQLRTPPIADDDPRAPVTGVTVYQFPEWFVTDVLETHDTVRSRMLVPRKGLTKAKYIDRDRKRRDVVPIRFVRACRRGHIGDISWRGFVHVSGDTCSRPLWLDERGTSGDLSEVFVRCECKAERSMGDAINFGARPLGTCDGGRPWLGKYTAEECGEPNRLLVRTASNAYFAQVMSVISLPDRDEDVVRAVDRVWDGYLQYVETDADLARYRDIPPVKAAIGHLDDQKVLAEMKARLSGKSAQLEKPVKTAELEVLMSAKEEIGADVPGGSFYARSLPESKWKAVCPAGLDKVVLVHRLREVRAQLSFTRFETIAPDAEGELELGVQPAALARELSWLPAVENSGEGFFLAFDTEAINKWLARDSVKERGELLVSGFDEWKADHKASKRSFIGLPYVMLHTLSHLLLTAVSVDCGYPASSIRERIYASGSGYGLLLYTGSSDAEGTLGGLVEAGRSISRHLADALDMGGLCSNDPICSDHDPSSVLMRRFLHGAACHGCVLIAETSCEQHNDYLDRALVVPTIATPDAAFFAAP